MRRRLTTKRLKRDSRRPGAWFGLAKIYQKEGKYEEALQAVGETLKVVPASDKAHYLRGQLLLKLGRKEEAQAGVCQREEIDGCGFGQGPGEVER